MVVAAAHWNPVLVALFGSLGASLGEFSSYFFGYLGKRISINENMTGYRLVQTWIRKYGIWAIALLSFQPVLPFEIGGFIAGLARMPIHLFLPAIWIGKFPKYLILIYLGSTIVHFFH
jgi:membrane protein YqaA with SNARE-associated domain